MDFRNIFQFRNKKIWWLDVIFYFVMSLLVATILCYLVFIVKNVIQKKQIAAAQEALLTVGTQEQKSQEAEVILYKRKINDFSNLIKDHEFASNAFVFLEEQTQPNVWFSQFGLDEKNSQIQLTGEAEDMEAFSRQTATFEKNEYVKNLGTVNSSLSEFGKIDFNFNITLDPKIFSYIINAKNQEAVVETQNVVVVSGSLSGVTNPTTEETEVMGEDKNAQQGTVIEKSGEKLIFAFDIPLNPEVIGTLDQTNHAISLVFPFGTDITKLAPMVIISDNATVFPLSDTIQDFSNPVIYQVTAQDGTTQNYTVSAKVLPEEKSTEGAQGLPVAVKVLLGIAGLAFLIVMILAIFLFIRKKDFFRNLVKKK